MIERSGEKSFLLFHKCAANAAAAATAAVFPRHLILSGHDDQFNDLERNQPSPSFSFLGGN